MRPLLIISTFASALVLLTLMSATLFEERIEKDLRKTANKVSETSQYQLDIHHRNEDQEVTPTVIQEIKTAEIEALLPYFSVTEDDRKNTITLAGEIASSNEKQQLITSLTTALAGSMRHRLLTDQLITSDRVTTILHRDQLFELCAQFLTTAENSILEWAPQQIKLHGELKTEKLISETLKKFEELSQEDGKIQPINLTLIKPPSLGFTLERLSNNTIILKGTLPNKAMRETLYQLVINAHTATINAKEKSYIANNLNYTNEKINAWWIGYPELFIGDFLKQTRGIAKIEYSNEGLYIEGIYEDQEDFIQARGSFQAIPKHLYVHDDYLRVRPETTGTISPLVKDAKIKNPSITPER